MVHRTTSTARSKCEINVCSSGAYFTLKCRHLNLQRKVCPWPCLALASPHGQRAWRALTQTEMLDKASVSPWCGRVSRLYADAK